MVYDGIGSFSRSKTYRKTLIEIGVEVHPFLPFKLGRFLSSLNYRNHRKIIVVDGGDRLYRGGLIVLINTLRGMRLWETGTICISNWKALLQVIWIMYLPCIGIW